MIKFNIDSYTFIVHHGRTPECLNRWTERSAYVDFDGLADIGIPVYIGIIEAGKVEMMTIAFNVDPFDETFFHPELLFLPESKTLFVGGGRKAMTYSLKDKVKLSNRQLAAGFWYWAKHENVIILVEELEIAVYDYEGNFIWERSVDPPWSYGIEGNILKLDIMDSVTKYNLTTGKLLY